MTEKVTLYIMNREKEEDIMTLEEYQKICDDLTAAYQEENDEKISELSKLSKKVHGERIISFTKGKITTEQLNAYNKIAYIAGRERSKVLKEMKKKK